MKKIKLFEPQIGKEEIKAVTEVMKSGWLAKGKVSEEFEKEFARYVGGKYAIFTNGCTSALKLALRALGSAPGQVIVPSLTFTATAASAVETGYLPVFADVSLADLCLRQDDVFSKITPHTKAIIPVHYGGMKAKVTGYPVPVIVDSAHLVEKNGFNRRALAQCYSFYASKVMTTGAGGMLVTNNRDFYEKAKLLNNDGVDKSSLARYDSSPDYQVLIVGGGYDATDLQAAIGRVQLKRLPGFEKRRQEIVRQYNRAFGRKWLGTYLYPILVPNREGFMAYLKDCGIPSAVFYLPLHLQLAYRGNYAPSQVLPVTEFVGRQVVCLPLHPGLTDFQVKYICKKVKAWL